MVSSHIAGKAGSFNAVLLVPLDKLYLLGVLSELFKLLLAQLSIVAAHVCCSRPIYSESHTEQVALYSSNHVLHSKYLYCAFLGSCFEKGSNSIVHRGILIPSEM